MPRTKPFLSIYPCARSLLRIISRCTAQVSFQFSRTLELNFHFTKLLQKMPFLFYNFHSIVYSISYSIASLENRAMYVSLGLRLERRRHQGISKKKRIFYRRRLQSRSSEISELAVVWVIGQITKAKGRRECCWDVESLESHLAIMKAMTNVK